MAALSPEYLEILKRELAQYVPHLPPLLPTNLVQQPDKQTNRALSAFALDSQLDISAQTASKAVIDDFDDQGIDAIYYEAKTETLHLVQSKLKGDDFKLGEAQAFCAGARLLFRQAFDDFNQNVLNRQGEIETALSQASHIQLWVVYTGSGITGTAQEEFNRFFADEAHGETGRLIDSVRYVGPDDLLAELRRRNSYKPVNAELILMNEVSIKEPRPTWYGMVELKDLVALHVKEDKALYEKNVRYYLGSAKSSVNKAIQNTLISDPKSFFFLNNGITALCSNIDPKDKKANKRRLKVRGLSIINGAQTVASAAELARQPNAPDISDARVMLTLIQTNADGTFGPRVTRARNSQNLVQVANFAAQDPIQERLTQELQGLGIEYHVRPEAGAKPSTASILLPEAVAALSWLTEDPRYPVWLKSGKGELANVDSPAYKALFTEQLAGAHLANAVYCYRAVHELLVKADQGSAGKERLLYRHGLNAIGWSFLKRLRGRIQVAAPLDPSTIAGLVSQPFDAQRQVAFDLFPKEFVGPLAYFKSQTDTTPFLINLLERAYGMHGDPTVQTLKQPQVNEAFPRQKLFAYLCQRAPQI